MLLRPEFGVVPFEGRRSELEELRAWLAGDEAFRMWLWTGGGGSGKTRLMNELAAIAGRDGWLAGWLSAAGSEPLLPETLEPHRASGLPLLLLLDEAHQRPTQELVRLLKILTQGRPEGGRCRLVLVARGERGWWDQLKEETVQDVTVHLTVEGARRTALEPLLPALSDRMASFHRAVAAFTGVLGGRRPDGHSPPGRLNGYEAVLSVQAEALLACLIAAEAADAPGQAALADPAGQLWDGLLRLERAYWMRQRQSIQEVLSDPGPQLAALVALASLCGAETKSAALAVTRALPWLQEATAVQRSRLDVCCAASTPARSAGPRCGPTDWRTP